MKATSLPSDPGGTSVSLFRNSRYGPVASSAAWLLATEKPRFRSFRFRSTSGNSPATISGEPSALALSTTIVCSRIPGPVSRNDARRLRSNSRPFQFTIQIETSGRSGMRGDAAVPWTCGSTRTCGAAVNPSARHFEQLRIPVQLHPFGVLDASIKVAEFGIGQERPGPPGVECSSPPLSRASAGADRPQNFTSAARPLFGSAGSARNRS